MRAQSGPLSPSRVSGVGLPLNLPFKFFSRVATASVGRPETWLERAETAPSPSRSATCRRGREVHVTPKTATDRPGAVPLDGGRLSYEGFAICKTLS